MKKLTRLDIAELELETLFAGKVWVFTPVLPRMNTTWGLGIAVANEHDYSPVPLSRANADTLNEMEAHADELNAQMGIDRDTALRIVASTGRFKLNEGYRSHD